MTEILLPGKTPHFQSAAAVCSYGNPWNDLRAKWMVQAKKSENAEREQDRGCWTDCPDDMDKW